MLPKANERVLIYAIITDHDNLSLVYPVPSPFNTGFIIVNLCAGFNEPIPIAFSLILKFEASDIELWKFDLVKRICNY